MAYADFVTAMMAFFLVMWITAQSKPVKQAVAQYFEDPLGTNDGSRSTAIRGPEDATTVGNFESGRGPGRSLAMANLKSNARRNAAGVSAVKPPRMLVSREDQHTRSAGVLVSFAENDAALDESAKGHLSLLVPLLLGKPNVVEIRSPLERRPLPDGSSFANAWALSYSRCDAIRSYLIESGITPERLRTSQTGVHTVTGAPEDGRSAAPEAGRSVVEVFALSEYARPADQPYATHDLDARKPADPHGHEEPESAGSHDAPHDAATGEASSPLHETPAESAPAAGHIATDVHVETATDAAAPH